MILDYTENRSVTVRQSSTGSWLAEAAVNDSLLDARLTLEIVTPGLNIAGARYDILRSALPYDDMNGALERLNGVRVGPGMTKIVSGVLGGLKGSDILIGLALEAMEAIILAYTAMEFKTNGMQGPVPGDEPQAAVRLNPIVAGPEGVRAMAAQNPRLNRSCVAFMEDE